MPTVLAAAAAPAPPSIGAHSLLVFLLQVGLLLAVALLLGRVAVRLHMPAVAGELAAGLLFGPTVLGHLTPAFYSWLLPHSAEQYHVLDGVGQIGVVLFVGVTGIEIDLRLVRRNGPLVGRIGIAGLLVPLGLGVAGGFLAPATLVGTGASRTVFALFVGVAMAVSALPVIAKALADMRLVHRDIGQLIISVGVVDDVLGWMLLSVVSAAAASGLHARSIALSVVYLVAVLAAAAFVFRPGLSMVLRTAGRPAGGAAGGNTGAPAGGAGDGGGPVVAIAVLAMVLGAALTQSIGFEAMLGAFLAGLLIGSAATPDLLRRLAPLRTVVMTVFAPLYFATAGLRVDVAVLARPAVALAAVGALVIAVVGKFSGVLLGAVGCRLTKWERLALASGTNARGVIQIVVAAVGLRIGVIGTAAYTIIILVAIVTSMMVGPLLRRAMTHIEHTEAEHARRRVLDAFWGQQPSDLEAVREAG